MADGTQDFAVFAFEDKEEAARKVQEQQEEDSVEVKARSRQLMDAFKPIYYFMVALGRFPHEKLLTVTFKNISKALGRLNDRVLNALQRDGTMLLRFQWTAPLTIFFILSSTFSIVLFIWVSFGLMAAYVNLGEDGKMDICGQTWERAKMREAFTPILIVWSTLLSLFISSLLFLLRAKDMEKYFNYWNRAVQAMDMNLNYRVTYVAVRDTIIFSISVAIHVALYAIPFNEELESTVSMMANSIIRFDTQDYFVLGSDYMKESRYQMLRQMFLKGKPAAEEAPFAKTADVILYDALGLVVIIFGKYGLRCFIVLFIFFTQCMRNAAWIWNERFRNYLRGEQPDPTDQTKRRIDQSFLIKDHLILVQVFKLTESNFIIVLQVLYCSLIVNLILILYSFTLITTASNCHEYWELAATYRCGDFDQQLATATKNAVTFESPNRDPRIGKVQHILLHSIMLIEALMVLYQTTSNGAAAYEEAMRGWQILRRHSFMTATTNRDRNFIHSLIISYARNNPMQISAGGYFDVNKELLVTIIVTALIYYTIMLQFRPGELRVDFLVCNGTSNFDIYSPFGVIP